MAGAHAWSAVLVSRGGQVVGALPYVVRRRIGQTFLVQPKLTQTLGPWIRPSDSKPTKRLADEKDILGALAEGLPKFALYRQNWHWERTNWLPFFWRGFEQSTLYTYRLDLMPGEDELWKDLQTNIRTDIRKAKDRFQVSIREAHNLEEFLSLNRKTFARQSKVMPYKDELVYRIDEAATPRKAREILVAEDHDGRLHAGAYILRDSKTAYYLIGGGDPAFRSSGAGSLCLWEAIRRQPGWIDTFDFEGSMLEPVERFFRAFGAKQVPYFQVQRINSRLLRAVLCARKILRKS